MTRQTVYRLFDGKTAVLEYIAAQRISALGEQLKTSFSEYPNLEVALVEGSLVAIRSGIEDPLLIEIFEHSDDHDFEKFLFRGTTEIQSIMMSLWGPLLDDARSRGVLREKIPNWYIVEWIRNIHALAVLRSDYGIERQREMLKTFLLPSIVKN